jgi:PadR family transcriptional regulator, regulatory protein PadR
MELLRGTLDLLILTALSRGAMHGYAIATLIRESTRELLVVQEGVLYPTLRKLEAAGLLASEWRRTESGREARFYELTRKGRQQLAARDRDWRAYVEAVEMLAGRA